MQIKEVDAKIILDSRNEETIEVKISTNFGEFSASSPTGKSTGKYEAKPYKKDINGDIKSLKEFSEYFSSEFPESLDDLKRVEDIVEGHIGANSLFALESACLKAIAKEQKKEVWQVINPKAKAKIRLVGNCIGGGKHSKEIDGKKPDFQEFLLIANKGSVRKNWEEHLETKDMIKKILKKEDEHFLETKNDEDAWMTSLNEKQVIDILLKTKLPLGVDIASSSFYKRKKYLYENPLLKRNLEEHFFYLKNIINNTNLFYVEDPFDEEDFSSFAKLKATCKNSLIVGDDLTVTTSKRFHKAIGENAINGIIVKPNQCGSLLEVKKVCEIAKENNIKIIFSHRSGETKENILADLAYGFEADFLKCGITGIEREVKIKRLIEIEESKK
jgi:enolase